VNNYSSKMIDRRYLVGSHII